MKPLVRVIKYIKKYWWYVAAAALCTLILNAFTLLQPQLIKYIMDNVISSKGSQSITSLNIVIGGFLLLIIMKGIFSYLQGYLLPCGVNAAIRDMRDEIFAHILHLPLRKFEVFRTGDLMVRITNDTGSLGDVLGLGLINFVNDILVLVGALCLMIYMDWKMTLMIMLLSPIVVIAVSRFGQYVEQAVKKNQIQMSHIYNTIEESITGIRVIKNFVTEPWEERKFKRQNQDLFGLIMKVIQFKVTQVPVVEFLAALGIAVSIWYGGYQVIKGSFTVGDIFAFWGYMIMATNPLNRISQTYSTIRGCIVSAQRIFEVLDSSREMDLPDAADLPPVTGSLAYDHVSFCYNTGTPVLKDISFTAEPGKVLALVGQSGAGKTTAINLLTRFYEPTGGTITIDGMDIQKTRLRSLRNQIAIVPQDTLLFSGTIRENIAYGNQEASDEEVISAAKAAHAHEFIETLPSGYHTSIGERGTTLSGGQRQRIAIARAILKDPRILILDEATSSVDAISEEHIQKGLEALLRGRTTIVIAHRISTIKKADKILVFNSGTIAEEGTHDDLIARGGVYSSLYESYFKTREN